MHATWKKLLLLMNAKNKGTADKYVHVSKTAFPELTICQDFSSNNPNTFDGC